MTRHEDIIEYHRELLDFCGITEPRKTKCPKCGGQLQGLGGGSSFCWDCDWDNFSGGDKDEK